MADTSLIFNLLARDKASKVIKGVGGAFKRMSGLILGGGAVSAAGMLVMAKQLNDMSNKIKDLDVKAKTVFEGQLPKVNAWANANKAAFGTSRREVVAMAANMADLLKPMGFTAAQAGDMSTKMLDLSGALSKWTGGTRSAAEVSEILSKAMLGERDGLKELGISISEADVQRRLAKKGQEDLKGAELERAKALATQELILEKSTDAQKAWADGGKKAAEAQNGLNSRIAEAKEKLAKGLTPALQTGMKFAVQFADWASNNQGTVKTLAVVIGGLGAAVLAVSAGMKVYAAGVAVVKAVTVGWTAVQWLLNTAFLSNPLTWIILAIVALIAVIVLIATKTTWFQQLWHAIWGKIGGPVKKVWNWIRNNWPLLLAIITGPIGIAVLVIAKNWGRIKSGAKALWGFVKSGFKGLVSVITAPFRAGVRAGRMMASGIRSAWNATVGGRGFTIPGWVPGLGGRSFRIPRFHLGGVVPGPLGSEQLILARAGETVRTREQERARGGAAGGMVTVEFNFRGADEELARAFRKIVRVKGGTGPNSVQIAFGKNQ